MRQSLEDLYALLLEQKSLLEILLALSREERRIIIAGEADKLEGIVIKEMRELSKLNAIEKKRLALHPVIAAELSLSENDLTVSDIAGHADPNERETLKKIQVELTSLLKQHTDLNLENRELIQAHFEYSESVLDLMVEYEDPLNNFYGEDGRATPDKKKTTGFFDGHA